MHMHAHVCTIVDSARRAVQMHHAEMVWVDTLGADFRGHTVGGDRRSVRYKFARGALNEYDAISMITMAGQQAWEAERKYKPAVPQLAAEPQA
jgi:hypothetical protein